MHKVASRGETAKDRFAEGLSYYRQKNYNKALSCFSKCVQKDPSNSMVWSWKVKKLHVKCLHYMSFKQTPENQHYRCSCTSETSLWKEGGVVIILCSFSFCSFVLLLLVLFCLFFSFRLLLASSRSFITLFSLRVRVKNKNQFLCWTWNRHSHCYYYELFCFFNFPLLLLKVFHYYYFFLFFFFSLEQQRQRRVFIVFSSCVHVLFFVFFCLLPFLLVFNS